MDFYVIPSNKKYGPIPAATLKYALRMKHGLASQLNMGSTIQDSDGFVISEKEQSAYLYDLLH